MLPPTTSSTAPITRKKTPCVRRLPLRAATQKVEANGDGDQGPGQNGHCGSKLHGNLLFQPRPSRALRASSWLSSSLRFSTSGVSP